MHWIAGGVAAIFDGDKGILFTVVLVALLVAGVIMLVLNLSLRPKKPAPPAWEPVPDDESETSSPARAPTKAAKGPRRPA